MRKFPSRGQVPRAKRGVLWYNVRRKAAKNFTGAAPFSRASCQVLFARCFARGVPTAGADTRAACRSAGTFRGRKRNCFSAREGRRPKARRAHRRCGFSGRTQKPCALENGRDAGANMPVFYLSEAAFGRRDSRRKNRRDTFGFRRRSDARQPKL